MPPSNRKWRVLNRKVLSKKQKNASRKRKSGRLSSSFKSVIATGVRTLSSFVPGQTIVQPVVDFLLKTFGVIKFYLNSSNEVEGKVTLIGASTSIPFYTGDFFARMDVYGCPESGQVRPETWSGDKSNDGVTVLGTRINHKSVRLLQVTWNLVPTGEFGKRSGAWAMAWQPNYTSTEDSAFNIPSLKQRPPTFENVRQMTYSTWGPATRGLSLTWRPKIQRDGYAALPRNMMQEDAVPAAGWIFLAFEDQNRPAGARFSLDELSVELNVRARGAFSVKEMTSTLSPGTQTLFPTVYLAEETTVMCRDEVAEYDLTVDYSGDYVSAMLPKDHPRYPIISEKLARQKLDAMQV